VSVTAYHSFAGEVEASNTPTIRRLTLSRRHQLSPIARRATRRHFSAEDKIRIVLEGLRGEDSIAELCRREGIVQNLYYRWSKDFLEAGKKRLAGDTARAATSDEVKDLRREASALKEVVAELTLENRLLKKSVTADGEEAT
jgi:transposase